MSGDRRLCWSRPSALLAATALGWLAVAPRAAAQVQVLPERRIVVNEATFNQWALGGSLTDPFGLNNGYFQQLYGAPNTWRLDAGKLTNTRETEEYKAAATTNSPANIATTAHLAEKRACAGQARSSAKRDNRKNASAMPSSIPATNAT